MTRDVRTHVLVTFGSSRGGTAEIATAIAEALRERGVAVDCLPVSSVHDLASYDAVIIGGALYARRWIREVRRFVTRNMHELRRRPVWMFSSGPLDASAGHHELPPPPRVAVLMARVGARGHATFGGSLGPDAKGFPASVMAKTRAGDWRDWEQIRSWALGVAHALAGEPRSSLLAQSTISADDLDRLIITDDPVEAVRAIRSVAMSAFGLSYGPRARRRWWLGE